jgi:MFS family permease
VPACRSTAWRGADPIIAICADQRTIRGRSSRLGRPRWPTLPCPRERIRAFGLLFWAANLGFSVSTVTGGVLAQHGYRLLFWLNAAASVTAALIVWRRVPETLLPRRSRCG